MATNVNRSELGLLAQTDAPAAAHRIFDAHSKHAALAEVAAELGVTSYTLRMWQTRLADTPLWSKKRVKVTLPNGKALENGIKLGAAIEKLRAYHADPDGAGEPIPETEIATARERLRLVIEQMEAARHGDALPAGLRLPQNLTELGKPFLLDKYRLSRFAHENGALPPPKLRALITYLAEHTAAPASTPTTKKPHRSGEARV